MKSHRTAAVIAQADAAMAKIKRTLAVTVPRADAARLDAPRVPSVDPVTAARRRMHQDLRDDWRKSPSTLRADEAAPAVESRAPTAHGSAAAESDAWKRLATAVNDWRASSGSAAGERTAWRELDAAMGAWRSAAESCRGGAPADEESADDAPAAGRRRAPAGPEMIADGGGDSVEAAMRRMMLEERNRWRSGKPDASAYDTPDEAA